MSPYKNVKHVMIPLKPVSPEQRTWIEATAQLASAFSVTVHGPDEAAAVTDSFILQLAAERVWTDSGGAPAWSELDVDKYLDETIGGASDEYAYAVLTLTAFYHWLVNAGYAEIGAVDAILTALERRMFGVLGELGYVPPRPRRERSAVRSGLPN